LPIDKGKIPHQVTCTLIDEATSGAGTTEVQASIEGDSVVVSLFAEVVTGTLDVTVYTLTEDGKELEIISFPQLSAPTSELLLKKAALAMSRIRVEATYTGQATYEVRAKPISAGETSVRLLGASEGKASQITIPSTATVLIPASLTDRSGLIVKNFDNSKTIYLGYTLAETTTGNGYPLGPQESMGMDIAAGVTIYAISDSPSADVRIMEAAF
jgi:hypothetical protein